MLQPHPRRAVSGVLEVCQDGGSENTPSSESATEKVFFAGSCVLFET